jgi:hypothetical protein
LPKRHGAVPSGICFSSLPINCHQQGSLVPSPLLLKKVDRPKSQSHLGQFGPVTSLDGQTAQYTDTQHCLWGLNSKEQSTEYLSTP